jgi:hypothetical protein
MSFRISLYLRISSTSLDTRGNSKQFCLDLLKYLQYKVLPLSQKKHNLGWDGTYSSTMYLDVQIRCTRICLIPS